MNFAEKDGFTLIEIILAIAILGLVVVPVFSYMINSSGLITHADTREVALLIAQQRMETVKNKGYANIDIKDTYVDITGDTDLNYDETKYPDFTIKQKVTENDVINLKTIKIKLTWNSNKEVELKTNMVDR